MIDLKFNPFEKIGNDWALVSAGDEKKSNTMTVSWGGVGVIWNKDVVYIFIRDSRYTKEFIDNGDTFSLAFLPEKYKKALTFCGKESGRSCDKWKKAELTPVYKNGTIYPKEAYLTFLCKKLACIPVTKDTFISPEIEKCYINGDYHKMYVGEIIEIIGEAE